MMKKAAIIVLSSLSFMLPSAAQEPVPYAYRPSRQGEGYIPTLAAIMREIQFCHIKLSYAGQQSNWELANYEVAQIENNLSNALQLYQTIPIVKIKLIDQPLVDLSQAVNAKDKVRFVRAFTDMTNACNSCHEAANVSFISIQVPTSSPFSDQSFAPKKERSQARRLQRVAVTSWEAAGRQACLLALSILVDKLPRLDCAATTF